MESRRRTIAKSITYRILGGLITLAVAFLATGKISAAFAIGALDTFIKIGAFYMHERLWLRVAFGRSHEPEYHI